MRVARTYAALRASFAGGCDRFGFRLVHYVVLNDHLHLVVEAADRASMSRGMQGLLIRVAKALNRVWGRKGGVFAERYWYRPLTTPLEVRRLLVYVLANGKKHEAQGRQVRVLGPMDMYASGPWFDGWRESVRVVGLEGEARPMAVGQTWLLGPGWRLHGLIGIDEVPAGTRHSA